MDTFSLNLGKQLYVFLEEVTSVKLPDDHQEFIKRLRNFEEKWESWSSFDKHNLLSILGDLILNQELYVLISRCFTNILPELFYRAHLQIVGVYIKDRPALFRRVVTVLKLTLFLLENVPCSDQLLAEIRLYLNWVYDVFDEFFEKGIEKYSLEEITDSVKFFLQSVTLARQKYDVKLDIETKGSLSNFLCKFREHNALDIRWLALHLTALITNVVDVHSFLRDYLTEEDYLKMHLQDIQKKTCAVDLTRDSLAQPDFRAVARGASKNLLKIDFIGDYVPIFDALVTSYLKDTRHLLFNPKLQLTSSTLRNLHSVMTALMSGLPVLLTGNIGSGKTALIDFVGDFVGRKKPPEMLSLQLGEQVDSKSLIGTYVCSEKPGEFRWQPGTLSQAVEHGSWLVLEDIDTAPADVISTIVTIIKTKSLKVHGSGKEIQAAEGFQIFATSRSDGGGFSHRHNMTMATLKKMCYTVQVKAPDKQELVQIVRGKHREFINSAFNLVDIYCLVSADRDLATKKDVDLSKLPTSSRNCTPRDLLKFCKRVLRNFEVSSTENSRVPNAEITFYNAVQCFCSAIPKHEDRVEVAHAIGAKLSLTREKVEYFLLQHKPDVKREGTIFEIGIHKFKRNSSGKPGFKQKFAFTRHTIKLLESLAVCVKYNEPTLLVGETGCGKTSTVQYLAEECGHKVSVVNMSQQSDVMDLLGGFKPVDLKQIVKPVKDAFENLFIETYSREKNAKFLGHIYQCFCQSKWPTLIKLMTHCCKKALEKPKKGTSKEDVSSLLKLKWISFKNDVQSLEERLSSEGLVFNFIEGTLVTALKSGHWVLLDEVNLATAETLECLSGLLDSDAGSLVLTERGDIKPVQRHPDFRIFACMNPATDIGKKDLPYGIRNRFTEIYVDEPDDENDLKTLVAFYMKSYSLSSSVIDGIVRFYFDAKAKSVDKLKDGAGNKPHYSLRTLCRALEYAANMSPVTPLRAIYEGLCMSFLTQLARSSHPPVIEMIKQHVFSGVWNIASILSQPLPKPPRKEWLNIEGYWLNKGSHAPTADEKYVLTESVQANLKDLARIVSTGRYPVLLQGETSVGKTSLITYLANLTGNHCVRINNHEHTDIQEYIGCYGADDSGKLLFKDGVLVTAMRKGYWIILDELNLAPTDVLEALNRLLDDNRELFIAETQEVVAAQDGFMLFATQNPPGHYGGRKVLSRAFRNRFVELHFDEIPSKELEEILQKRCHLPKSYSQKFVKVMLDLQVRRRNSGIFAGKHSFMTLRDLFRWAERYRLSEATDTFHDWEMAIAEDGYMLIAGRCRKEDECQIVRDVIEKNFKKRLNIEKIYDGKSLSSMEFSSKIFSVSVEAFQHIVWTENMRRMAILVARALKFGESVLLVGETGCGKTTLCQLFATVSNQKLYTVNCHMHTESSDFLGGLRPCRVKKPDNQSLFEWYDGPLVDAMRNGEMFLIDEISLTEDSVLERLNSVLESDRMLVLSEKGEVKRGKNKMAVDILKAHEDFRLIATMNPGGDFGKKELSPALRNRFTEIWCSTSDSFEDVTKIIEHNISPGLRLAAYCSGKESGFGKAMVDFIKWFKNTEIGSKFVTSIRDLLSWVQFINMFCKKAHRSNTRDEIMETDDLGNEARNKDNQSEEAYIHGACLVFVDAIGSGNIPNVFGTSVREIHSECIKYLQSQVGFSEVHEGNKCEATEEVFGIHPFFVEKGELGTLCPEEQYNFNTTTTKRNCIHLLRGLQLPKPILLEGAPGVGKTSLVVAVAKMAGHPITRINLSEETDVTDLFGMDFPTEGDGKENLFAWRDGPLLKALKAGHWILFDELNLASQSVLEGLNACFDHRGEVFIPALNKTFQVNKDTTKIFACQNPLNQGGGRKGLPKSFLNRFTKVFIDAMSADDFFEILTSSFPDIEHDVIRKMVSFNSRMHQSVVEEGRFGRKGSPWEFNVRDMMRWCHLLQANTKRHPGDFIGLIYQHRMREFRDKEQVLALYQSIFHDMEVEVRRNTRLCDVRITPSELQVGYSQLRRCKVSSDTSDSRSYQLLRWSLPYIEDLAKCVEMKWMAILPVIDRGFLAFLSCMVYGHLRTADTLFQVGGEGSCKNSLVRILSRLCGQHLDVLSMNSAMDTTDFIGGFEQFSVSHHVKRIYNEASYLASCLLVETSSTEDFQSISELIERITINRQEVGEIENENRSLVKLQNILNELKLFNLQTDHLLKLNEKLKERFDQRSGSRCRFEWLDGVLVEALKKGHWMLIENVNFCSPSVLDRLNGLLEPEGVLAVDERGVLDGEIIQIKPHPNFRLFLSMDPKFGEISRAMRNRGIEIFIPNESDGFVMDNTDTLLMLRSKVRDEHGTLLQAVSDLHHEINRRTSNRYKQASLLQAVILAGKLLQKGTQYHEALKLVRQEVYCFNEEIELDSIVNVVGSRDASLIQYVPSVQDYRLALPKALMQRYSIPFHLKGSNMSYDKKTQVLMFLERCESSIRTVTEKLLVDIFPELAKQIENGIKIISGTSEQGSLMTLWNADLQDADMIRITRLYFQLIHSFNSIDDIVANAKQGSVMTKKLKSAKAGTPTEDICFHLQKLVNSLVKYVSGTLMNAVKFDSIEGFAKLEVSFKWLWTFLQFCCASPSLESKGVSRYELVLNWKWFSDYHLKHGFALPSEYKWLVVKLDTLLGEDKLCMMKHDVTRMLGSSDTYTCNKEYQLLKRVESLGRSHGPADVQFCRMIIECYAELWARQKNGDDAEAKVGELERMAENRRQRSEIPRNGMWDGKLANKSMSFQALIDVYWRIMPNHSQGLVAENVAAIYEFSLRNSIIDISNLANLKLVQLELLKDIKNLTPLYAECLNSIYEIAFENLPGHMMSGELLVDGETTDDKLAQESLPYLSPCVPIIKFLKDQLKWKQKSIFGRLEWTTPIGQVHSLRDSIRSSQQFLWVNLSQISRATQVIRENSLRLSIINVSMVCESIHKVFKDNCCEIDFHVDDVLQPSTLENIHQLVDETVKFSKTQQLSSLFKFISEKLQELQTVSAVKSREVLEPILACACSLLMLEYTKPSLKYDPIEEGKARLEILKKQLIEVNMELTLRYHAEYYWTGFPPVNFQSNAEVCLQHFTSNPARVKVLLECRKLLMTQMSNIKNVEFARPEVSQYTTFRGEFDRFCSSVGDVEHILTLMKDIQRSLENNAVIRRISGFISKLQMKIRSFELFVATFDKDFPLYRDLYIYPIANIRRASHALKTLKVLLEKTGNGFEFRRKELMPSDLFCQLSYSHMNFHLDAVCIYANLEMDTLIPYDKSTGKFAAESWLSLLHVVSLNHLQKYRIINKFKLKQKKQSFYHALDQLVKKIYGSWCRIKQSEIETQVKNESLFKYRSKVHCNTLSEEEQIIETQKDYFPTFEEEFEDLLPSDSLDVSQNKPREEIENGSVQRENNLKLDEVSIYNILRSIFVDRQSVLVNSDMSFKLAMQLLESRQVITGTDFSKTAVSLLQITSKLKYELCDQDHSFEESFDIYVDGKISDMLEAKEILDHFQCRLSQLFEQFEDHPALQQISLVIERIRLLPLCSPLMKLLAGFEFLLKQAQDWESYSSTHVSLREHLEKVTAKVISWRKLELRSWSCLLNKVDRKCVQQVSKWWFHFYNLTDDYKHKELTLENFGIALKHYLEQSTVGEYSARLDLLNMLMKYLESVENPEKVSPLINVLWNTHKYYNSFTATISQYQQEMRAPIEKELKDYVKIARWNEMNFYAMKQAVDKSHRTLNKYIRRYQNVLNEPVQQFLRSENVKIEEEKSYMSIMYDRTDKFLEKQNPVQLFQVELGGKEDLYINKVDNLQWKMKRCVRNIIDGMNYGQLVRDLDGFTGDIISSIKDLQKDNMLPPKEKRKAARNILQQQKRKALSSLFKELKNLGISHRKIVSVDLEMDQLPVVSEIKHLCWGQVLSSLLKSSNEYFFKSLLKQSLFESALSYPSKELSPREILRFKGLTNHIFDISMKQRYQLKESIMAFSRISQAIEGLKRIRKYWHNQRCIIPPQRECGHFMNELDNLLNRTQHGLTCLLDFINCCPEENLQGGVYSPFSSDQLPRIALCSKQDKEFIALKQKLEVNLQCVITTKKEFDDQCFNEEEFPLFHWGHWTLVKTSLERLGVIFSDIGNIISDIIGDRSQPNPFENIVNLGANVSNLSTLYLKECEKEHMVAGTEKDMAEEAESIVTQAESVVSALLIAIQTQSKQCDDFKVLLSESREDDHSIMLNGHLVPILSNRVALHFDSLGLGKILKSITTLLSRVQEILVPEKVNCLLNMEPLLEAYSEMVRYYVFSLLTLHRTTSKLLYVLYGLFTDLLTKGFCMPPEEDESAAEGEGATEFEDIQGGGLGEGQGAKDVSDQIESEDQVEDTKQGDVQENKQQDEGEQADIKEEKEGIEMSDDFDSKLQDMELNDSDVSGDENDDENEEDEPDKQMGDVDAEETVDEKMWGDSDEEDDSADNQKEERGEGADGKSESQLVAKDDNQGEQGGDDDNTEKHGKEDEINEMSDGDDHPDEQSEACDPLEEVKDNENDGLDKPNSIHEDIPEQMENERDETKESDENDGDTEMNDIEQVEDKVNDDMSEGEQNETAEGLKEEQQKQKESLEDEHEDDDRDVSIRSKTETEELIEESPDEVLQQDLSNEQSSLNHQQDQERSEDQGLGRVKGQEEHGHIGQADSAVNQHVDQKTRKRKDLQQSSEDRTIEKNAPQEAKKRRADNANGSDNKNRENNSQNLEKADFQHISEKEEISDDVIIDNATQDQVRQMTSSSSLPDVIDENDSAEDMVEEEGVKSDEQKENIQKDLKQMAGVTEEVQRQNDVEEKMDEEENTCKEEERDQDVLMMDSRSDYFTAHNFIVASLSSVQEKEILISKLRAELEDNSASLSERKVSDTDKHAAMEVWNRYEQLTAPLAQQLCEQLRLVLEPTLASKLTGDYRTGKRLNMRKVIPYIASQFRKDKIWLRRTKKSKRQYDIVLAVDDSSSMADNHSKQLAFESLSTIANALKWLEAGRLAICSFGEEANLVHPFHEPFTEESGARVLQQFTFDQKKTKIAQLLNMISVLMDDAKQYQANTRNVSQLLLIISDGRGIFLEGKEVVEQAVANAKELGIFIVFLILDNPKNKDSILDIRFPVFKSDGSMPEIKSYIEEFPFPFYVLLRDINALPTVLSDALKQWFELVTQGT